MLTDVLIATRNRADSGQDQTIVLSNATLKTNHNKVLLIMIFFHPRRRWLIQIHESLVYATQRPFGHHDFWINNLSSLFMNYFLTKYNYEKSFTITGRYHWWRTIVTKATIHPVVRVYYIYLLVIEMCCS